jgi:hypothetical protein
LQPLVTLGFSELKEFTKVTGSCGEILPEGELLA